LTFVYFATIVFSLCYLAADARIFGADTTAWHQVYHAEDAIFDEEAIDWIQGLGIFKLRQLLLPHKLFREHLGCYFCMGIWAGPAAHVLLWHLYQLRAGQTAWTPAEYWLWHPNTAYGWALGLVSAFFCGAVTSYFINAVLHRLEGDD